MEDEDGESKVTDTWSVLGEQPVKESSFANSLKPALENTYDSIEEQKLIHNKSLGSKDSPSKNNGTGSKIVFKGFKKRILAQAQETQTQEQQGASLKNGKEPKRGKITEYAQYLGLQPSLKNKCVKCHSSNLCSTIKQSLCSCSSTMTPMPSTSESSMLPHSPNFKITRKVYLCAACGTYFENWNLFLHMRDIHKRHICLFCLGMFGQAERLSYHLTKKHSVPEMAFTSVEDFYGAFKGSCYLVCCSCEKVFSETDNFYNHFCSPVMKQEVTASICTLCRQTGSHASTCSLAADSFKEVKNVSRKPVKNNRSKNVEDPSLKANAQLKKTNNKISVTQINENEAPGDTLCEHKSSQSEVLQSKIKDTVSETIMEVSKYIEDSSKEKEKNSEAYLSEKQYDSVTETIMEVSYCANRVDGSDNMIEQEDVSNKLESSSEDIEKLDMENQNSIEESNAPEIALSHLEIDENEVKHQTEESPIETKNDSSSVESDSSVNRSLFSPQHELPVSDHTKEENENKKPDAPSEIQTSVSFNTVPSSDRSLVIKICTNRNSQFSVTAASNENDAEDQDITKESEENNNAEDSLIEEKESEEFEEEKDRNYEVNDGDSDSDSFKLAVIDNSEETAEVQPVSEVKTELNVDFESPESQEEEIVKEKINLIEKEETLEANDESQDEVKTIVQPVDGIMLAGEDVSSIDLNVDGTLDSIEINELLKRCIEIVSPFCVYCNHARHIAVNGKQLGLHMLAEHKFQPQHPAIIIHAEQFISRVKKSLDELDSHFFNLDSYNSLIGTYNVPDVRTYECFHCRFHSAIHKELYLHNRKMHQKTILICIMCKSTFYSYSELLCHLCPGTYSPNINVKYRCCLCPITNLPSAFRLMVHLRKRHHACDVCLESTGNQQRLSNHVWKHKLHHLCYRCGIAYRNKPDITKHLFWKHGTESILCKKCLQKKWPHIYHFCIPPTAFVCEECGSSFSKAVALKVHKRLHSGDQPYACGECSKRFISKKLLAKHENMHKEPPINNSNSTDIITQQSIVDEEKIDKEKVIISNDVLTISESTKESKETMKKVIDVYDLPPLNLSSESDTDSEDEKPEIKEPEATKPEEVTESLAETNDISAQLPVDSIVDVEQNDEEKEQGAQIMDGIWDNFKTYAASLEMKDSNFGIKESEPETDIAFLRTIVLADHDYCVVWSHKDKPLESESKEEINSSKGQETLTNKIQKSPSGSNGVHNMVESDSNRKKMKSPKKKKQNGSTSSSDSSSDSDSSSCSCGTNCSCSSSSSGSSSSSSSSSDSDSSTSEGSPKKRKERKKDKEAAQEAEISVEGKEVSIDLENGGTIQVAEPACPSQLLLRESDLETEETETDEDFYDEHPQQLANKLLAEKRNQLLLLAAVAPASTESSVTLNNGLVDSPEPAASTAEDQPQQKRKLKTKKRKKGERKRATVESIKLNIPKAFYQKNSGFSTSSLALTQQTGSLLASEVDVNASVELQNLTMTSQSIGSGSETENKRSSKRKRVPKRFYGDSSDEEAEKQPTVKWRKLETPSFASIPSLGKPLPPRLSFGGKTAYRPVESQENLAIATSATESEEPAESSSDSSESEVEASQQTQAQLPGGENPVLERPVNLYCYCQCPYDEVSEMIACDGEDCRIEWFHFECVGIMVPPKGKWYCPDCRKKHGIMQNSEDYFDS